jgi:hypothetical protein
MDIEEVEWKVVCLDSFISGGQVAGCRKQDNESHRFGKRRALS